MKRFLVVYAGTFLIFVVFLSGLWVGAGFPGAADQGDAGGKNSKRTIGDRQTFKAPPGLEGAIDVNQLWKIWDVVQERYIDRPVSAERLFNGALSGVVASLEDPYSVYLDPETAKKFSDDLSGSFDGIGAEIGIKREQLKIIAPLEGSPAERAGLKAGDVILAINDIDTRGMTLDRAISLIRGKSGTRVVLKIFREALSKPTEIAVIRETIVVQSVRSKMLPEGIAYLKIASFDERAASGVRQAVDNLLGFHPAGLVVDLRNDPGGFLDTAVEIAGEWLKDEVVVYEQFHAAPEGAGGVDTNGRRAYRAEGRQKLAKLKTVVLVNAGSASASEILAGALQDHGRATIIGTRTFGKGSVQEYERLDDGSAVKITVARWLTPKGRAIEKDGIAPDIEVPEAEEDETGPESEKKDPALQKATEIILGEVK